MSSEWMKVMLDEISRKKSEASEVQAELERRRGEQEAQVAPGEASRGNTPGGPPAGGRPPQ